MPCATRPVCTTVAPPVTTTPTTFTPAQVAQIADLVNQANTHYAAAFAALRAGDLKTFADEMAQVGVILQKLQQITGTAQPPAGATPTPSPAASPSSSP